MFKKLLPRQENFFRLFKDAATELVYSAQQFQLLLSNLDEVSKHAQVIAHHEQRADDITFQTFELLHKSFITPFDRNDIHRLVNELDDVNDFIHRAAQRIEFYQLKEVPYELCELAQSIVHLAKLIQQTVNLLDNLNNGEIIIKNCNEIYRLEEQADQLLLSGVAQLFKVETDFKHFFKIKDIFEYIKWVLSHSQDVAVVIHGIVLEYS